MNSRIWRKHMLVEVQWISGTKDSWQWTLCVLSQLVEASGAEIRKGESQILPSCSPLCMIQFSWGENGCHWKELSVNWTYILCVCGVSLVISNSQIPDIVSSAKIGGGSGDSDRRVILSSKLFKSVLRTNKRLYKWYNNYRYHQSFSFQILKNIFFASKSLLCQFGQNHCCDLYLVIATLKVLLSSQ